MHRSMTFLPAFLAEVCNDPDKMSLDESIIAEKFHVNRSIRIEIDSLQWLRQETRSIPTWDKSTLVRFQKEYSDRNRYINKLPCTYLI